MTKLTPQKLIFLFFLIFFALVPNNDQGYDSYAFLLDARDGHEIVHPHHLLFNVFRYILYKIAVMTGIEPMKFISLASSVIGALCLAVIFRLLKRRALPEIALTGTMIIGMIFSFWYYSTSVEVNIVSALFLVLSLYFLMLESRDKNTFLAFLFLTIGILFHQILILALIPMLIYDCGKNRSIKRTLKLSMISLVPGFAIYIIVAFAVAEGPGLSGVIAWLTKYPGLGRWGFIYSGSVIASVGGIAKAVFGGSILRQALYGDGLHLYEILYLIGSGISFCGLAFLFVYAARNGILSKDSESFLFLGTAVVFAVFAFWWAPHDGGFWFYPVVLCCIMIFAAHRFPEFARTLSYIVLVVFALVNIAGEFVPASRIKNSVADNGAAALAKLNLNQNDLVLTNMAQIRLALDYQYHIKVPIYGVAYLEKGPKKEVIERYRSMISHFKGKVIIFENEIYPEPHRRFLFGRFSRPEYTDIYKPFLPSLVPVDSIRVYGEWITLFELKHEPATE